MAKLKAPLFSFSAAGKLGNSLVYFGWKGLQVVRQYVIPANPDTTGQSTQRDILKAAVDEWHETKYIAKDKTAWDKYAAILAKPMSGFNAFVKSWIDAVIAGITTPDPCYACSICTGGAGLMDASADEDGEAVNVWLHWGYTKTALSNTVQCVEAPANTWTKTGIAVTAGKVVYGRFETHTAEGAEAGWTGIYEFTAV